MARWFAACAEIYHKFRPEEGQDGDKDEADTQPGQDHVFAFYEELDETLKQELDDAFDDVAVEEVEEAWASSFEDKQDLDLAPPDVLSWELKRPPVLKSAASVTRAIDVGERKLAQWRTMGFELYSKGKVAVLILSGGQDARIGGGLPKGTLDIGLLSHKSIFQLYIERVRRLQHLVYRQSRHLCHIPVYIMCNRENRGIIDDFFRENNYFGIREQDLMLFTQNYMPLVNRKGKILLAEKHRIAMAPDGNGGVFRALVGQGMVSDMKSRGVTSLLMCSVDNILAKVGDPTFLGHCETVRVEAGIKCVEKIIPEEFVGVFCQKTLKARYEDVDGDGILDEVKKVRAAVIEPFELPEEAKRRRTKVASGTPPLELGMGNLSQYYFRVDFIKNQYQLSTKRWHLIPKTVAYVDPKTGEKVEPPPGSKNAYRLELFVFDTFDLTKTVVGFQVDRSEFALVKNLVGIDSPQTALQVMCRLHQKWIIDAGGFFEATRVSTEREDAKCEVSPLVSYEGEDLAGQFPQNNTMRLPFYLPSHSEFVEFSAASSAQTRRPSTHFLDWYSDLAQRELEIELQGNLGPVIEMIEDQSKHDYVGERADEDEVLPPTPRQDESGPAVQRRQFGKAGSKGGGKEGGGAGGGSASSPRGAASAERPGEAPPLGAAALLEDAKGGKPGNQTAIHSRGSDPKGAAAAGGSLAIPKGEDKKRDKYWGALE